MSYLVLARKYRPQAFEDVIGQASVTRTLQNAIENKRLAHAQIFSGVRGVGKTTVARILAKALNCDHGPTPTPCNTCPKCHAITNGTAVDVQEIDGASNRGIDEIRALRENCKFMPAMCRFRVYIIDEVHMLTKEAFNALLKTLEEPPGFVYFILATTESQKIPATIHSRCQHHEFKRLHHLDIARHLENLLQKEGLCMEHEAVSLIAKEADGSVRDSLSLLDQAIAYGVMNTEDLCDALGIVKSTVLTGLLKAILTSDVAMALEQLETAYLKGVELKGLLMDFAHALRDTLLVKELGYDKAMPLLVSGVDLASDEELKRLLDTVSAVFILQLLDMLMKSLEGLSRSSSPRILSEILLVRLCTIKNLVPLASILEKIGDIRPQFIHKTTCEGPEIVVNTARGQTKAVNFQPSATVATGKNTLESKQTVSCEEEKTHEKPLASSITNDNWKDFCDVVRRHNPPLETYLRCCKNIQPTDRPDQLILECNPGFEYEMLKAEGNLVKLRGMASEFAGRTIALSVVPVDRQETADLADTKQDRQQGGTKEQLLQHRLVQDALAIFDAKIVDVSLFKK